MTLCVRGANERSFSVVVILGFLRNLRGEWRLHLHALDNSESRAQGQPSSVWHLAASARGSVPARHKAEQTTCSLLGGGFVARDSANRRRSLSLAGKPDRIGKLAASQQHTTMKSSIFASTPQNAHF